jgi:cytochrome c peroxidase
MSWQHRTLLATVGTIMSGIVLHYATTRAEEPGDRLPADIAQVEQQVDSIEAETLAAITATPPGGVRSSVTLGKALFFDKSLSVNGNEACAFCHMPQTGFQGAIEALNLTGVAQPGSVRSRYGLRKPPSAAYAAFSPPLIYTERPGQGKCVHCFIGGNFWDLRATGLRLHNPSAMQAEGSPLNPVEMGNPDPACIVHRMAARPYRAFFESVWGPHAFNVTWPDDTEAVCGRPNNAPASAIGSETPDGNSMPYALELSPRDRARVQSTFDQMAEAIANYEASPELSPFSSKFDAFLPGKVELSDAESRGYALFNGKAKCNNCHVDPKGDMRPLFTDNTTANLGIPRNPDLAFYSETKPDAFGYTPNARGEEVVDKGTGNYLRSPENANEAWKQLAPAYDGRFRVVTLRNVDKRPTPDFVKAYAHNGYFKSLKEIVHFYNTRDVLPRCQAGSPGEKVSCWPAPEVSVNLNTNCCDLGLTDSEENDIVAFLGTLTDGYSPPASAGHP